MTISRHLLYAFIIAASIIAASTPTSLAKAAMSPLWTWTGEPPDRAGERMAGGRDVDGDAWPDLLLGLPTTGSDGAGRIVLFRGGPEGFEATPLWESAGTPGDRLGRAVALADVDGDGLAELLASAVVPGSGIGRLMIFSMSTDSASPTGADSVRLLQERGIAPCAWGDRDANPRCEGNVSRRQHNQEQASHQMPVSPSWVLTGTLTSDAIGDGFGAALSVAELTGDNCDDVLIGAPTFTNELTFEGRVMLFHGSASGLANTPSWTQEGNRTGAGFGGALLAIPNAAPGACHALLIGSPDAAQGNVREGIASLFAATPTGYELSWTARGHEPYAYFGYALAAGDIDADGHVDLMIGGFGSDSGRGTVRVFRGTEHGPETMESATLAGESASDYFGVSLAYSADIDGNGRPEVVVGAMGADALGRDSGRVHMFEWDEFGLLETGTIDGPSSGAFLGTCLLPVRQFAAGANDALLAGAPWFAGGSGWIGAFAAPQSAAAGGIDGLAALPLVVPNPATVDASRIVFGTMAVSRIDWVDASGRVLATIRNDCGMTSSVALSRFGVQDPPRRSWLRLSGPLGTRGVAVLLGS